MSLIEPIVQEYQREMNNTRKVLERIPDEKWSWKPHPKSMSIGELAAHIAESQGWTKLTLEQEEFVFDMATYKPFVAENRAGVLAEFDKQTMEAVKSMDGCSDEKLAQTWTMKEPGGKVFIQMPRTHVLRDFVISHTIHHRGQMTVYLRLLDVPLPQVYGPTADDQSM